jgi:hypothetical protein
VIKWLRHRNVRQAYLNVRCVLLVPLSYSAQLRHGTFFFANDVSLLHHHNSVLGFLRGLLSIYQSDSTGDSAGVAARLVEQSIINEIDLEDTIEPQ